MKYLIFFILCFLIISCTKNAVTSKQEERNRIDNLLIEIEEISKSAICQNSDDWTYTSFGDKACGGPVGFLAYSKKIAVNAFLEKVEKHRALEKAFNIKWQIASDCMAPESPIAVICKNGMPEFVYENYRVKQAQRY